jgi:hypothetical protein
MTAHQGSPDGTMSAKAAALTGSSKESEPARNAFSKSGRDASRHAFAPVPVDVDLGGAHFRGYVFNKQGQALSFGQAGDIGSLKAEITHPSHKERVCDVFLVKTADQKILRLRLAPGVPDPTLVVHDMHTGKRIGISVPASAELTLAVGGSLHFAPELANASIVSVWALENRSSRGFDDVAKPSGSFLLQGRRVDGASSTPNAAPSPSTSATQHKHVAKPSIVHGFKTAKGSTYQIQEDGTTIRNKAARSDIGHEGDCGVKTSSARTIYVDSSDHAVALSGAGMESPFGKGFHVVLRDGKASLIWGGRNGGWASPRSNRDIAFSETPEVGKYPVELWKPKRLEGLDGEIVYSGQHAGNQIVEMTYAELTDEPVLGSNGAQKAMGAMFSKNATRSI